MDLTVRSEGPWLPEDRSWLGSAHGTTATRTITLDVSAFTANTHYPNGYIPSGTVLAELASGLFGTSTHLGGALVVAMLATIATASGFAIGFLVAAAVVALGALTAACMLPAPSGPVGAA